MASNGSRKTLTIDDQRLRDRLMREVGPSAQESSGGWVKWDDAQTLLGQPFDVTRIPLSKLYQMRRDPMIAFALLFVKVPLVRAQWYIECERPDIAAFVDNALRRIYGRFIFAYTNCLDFGYSPMIKKFETMQPDWVYQDPDDPTKEKKVWDNGKVEAVVWKPFQALAPDNATPWWLSSGDFGGIIYKAQTVPSFAQNNSPKTKPDIPLDLALWATNDKDSVFGSLWGYPRIAHSYRFWWSYWYRWALADRHFERDADPPCYVYFPPADFDDEGEIVSNQAQALRIGEQIRSGSTVALPSGVVTDLQDKATSQRQWEIGFLQGGGNFTAFQETFAYLDVAKLRAIMVPEQAFLEGQGGTSSRNVAATMGDAFQESQAILQDEIDDHLNRYVIPQLVQANFGQGHVVRKRTRGFASQDVQTAQAIIQLFGQADPTTLEVDIREILRQLNIPLLTPKQLALEEAKAAKEAAAQQPPQTQSRNGFAGVNQWGFYYQPQETLALATGSTIDLPDTPHFDDEQVTQDTLDFDREWEGIYSAMYENFADYLDEINLSEEEIQEMHFGPSIKWVEAILKKWASLIPARRVLHERVAGFVRRIMDSAGKRELARMRVDDVHWSENRPEVKEWSDKRAAELVRKVTDTTKKELRRFLVKELETDDDPKAVAKKVRTHFAHWPGWKADRLARTESALAYNYAALVAFQSAGVTHVKAHDAAIKSKSDPECIERNGKVFTIEDAFIEQAKEHPNGTLSWSPEVSNDLAKKLQDIAHEEDMPMPPGIELPIAAEDIDFDVASELWIDGEPVTAVFDDDTNVVYFSEDADEFDIDLFLMSLADELNLGPWATLKKAWDESKIKRGFHGRFTFKPDVQKPAPVRYEKQAKKLGKAVEKKTREGVKKGETPDVSASPYLHEDVSGGITKAGKLNQKRLLAFATMACPEPHPPDAKKPEDIVLEKRTTTEQYSMRMSNGEIVWDPARKVIHDKIIDAFFRRRDVNDKGFEDPNLLSQTNEYLPSQEHPQVFFTGGGYSAGKGRVLYDPNIMGKEIPKDAITLDPDIIKSYLPEYDSLIEVDPSANMALYEEAWHIAKAIQAEAQRRRVNTIVDGISNTSSEEFLARVKSFSDAGFTYDDPSIGRRADGTAYAGRVVYVDIPTDEAIRRAFKRAREAKKKSDRRYIPEVIMRAVHRDVASTVPGVFEKAAEAGIRVELWDNTGATPVRVAFTDHNGVLQIEDQKLYDAFLAKAQEDITGKVDVKTPVGEKTVERKIVKEPKPKLKPALAMSDTEEVDDMGPIPDNEDPGLDLEEIYKRGWQADLPYESGDPNPGPLVYGESNNPKSSEETK